MYPFISINRQSFSCTMIEHMYIWVCKTLWVGMIVCMIGCSFSRKDKKVLLFSQDTLSMAKQLQDISNVRGVPVHVTQNLLDLVEDTLKNYSAVILHGSIMDTLNPRQQVDLERYVLAGGDLVGISLYTKFQHKWPWMEKLIAAFYSNLPQPAIKQSSMPAYSTHIDTDSTLWRESYGLGSISLFTSPKAAESQVLQHVIHDAIGENKWPDYEEVNKTRVPPYDRFSDVVLVDELNEPMELEVLDHGNVLLIERGGQIKFYSKKNRETRIIARLEVDNSQSNGLNGMAIDPDFQENHRIYFSYTPANDPYHQHISRFLLTGDSLMLNTEQVLMKVPIDARHGNHAENALEFDKHGNLYIGFGDFTHEPTGYAAVDERKGHKRSDAQRTAANTNDYRGKILRIHPEDDGTYTIPDDNLFPKDGSQGKPEIYIMGCRNPYRFSIDPLTNFLYWGDLGPDAGVDNVQGPKGYDEINQAREAGFYGWPYFVANNKPYRDFNFETQKAGPPFDPSAPFNNSPNNTGAQKLPPACPAILWYPYDITYEFPYMEKGGMNIMAGPVYRYDAFPPSDNKLPEYYDSKLFIYDWVRNWILAVTFDENYHLISVEPFLDSIEFSKPIDMKFGPDGSLYVLEYGAIGYAANKDARVRHITYAKGNRPPEAHIVVDKTAGATPFTVNFSAEGSLDYDKDDQLSFTWLLDQEGTKKDGKEIHHVYEKPGIYYPTLRITDQHDASSEAKVKIMAGNAPPEIRLKMKGNQSFYWGFDTLRYQVMVQDLEDGSLMDGSINPSDVKIDFSYQPGQNSLSSINVHQANDITQGEALVDASGCLSCHAISAKSVGPSYQAIAERYEDSEATFDLLKKIITKGGKGNWPGNLSMPAHPYLSEEETRRIIAYIFSLKQTTTLKDLPIQGKLITNQHTPEVQGNYALHVTYKDKGAGPIGPMEQSATFAFRSHRINTTACDDYAGAVLRAGSTAWILKDGGYLQFNGIDLSGIQTITYRAKARVKGEIMLRLDAPDGPVVGTAAIDNNEDEWLDISGSVEATSGIHDLYFVFTTDNHFNINDIRYLFSVDVISFELDKKLY